MTRSASATHRGLPVHRGAAGFTLVETMVTLAILLVVTFGLLALFDLNNRVARVQTNVADMQQSLRVGQHEMIRQVRQLGRGVLPARLYPDGLFAGKPLPAGIAVAVQPVTGTVKMGGLDDATVLRGTDILIVRGAFESPIYQLNPLNQNLVLTGDPPTEGSLTVLNRTSTGIPHDLGPLKHAIDLAKAGDQPPEPLLLISPQDDAVYAVVELDPASDYTADEVNLRFKITGGEHSASYNQISTGGRFSPDLQKVAYLALLEEYRYYIREDYSDDDRHTLTPKLSMARFYPG
ncbi:MAG TPA: prepilin-type N-terminal cleavage/methylation domain-containing protein, partial [Thermoanaerobaculia bacterium]